MIEIVLCKSKSVPKTRKQRNTRSDNSEKGDVTLWIGNAKLV